jgi:hypothetical protein
MLAVTSQGVCVSIWDISLAIGTLVLGVVATWFFARYYFRRGGGARRKVAMGLQESVHLDEEALGLDLKMKIGDRDLTNLVVLRLTVANTGPADVVIDDADDHEQHYLRPRIELPAGLRAIIDPWTAGGTTARSDVRAARSMGDGRQRIHVHIRRLATKERALINIVCTYPELHAAPALNHSSFAVYEGYTPDVDFELAGLLQPPAHRLGH